MPESSPKQQDVADAIAEEVLSLHRETYGKGARVAKALVDEDSVVVFLDDLELLPNEEFLIGGGEGQAVIEVRNRYQQAIGTSYRAAVERVTGRRVVSFVSATKLAPNYAVEIFRLGPAKASLDEMDVEGS